MPNITSEFIKEVHDNSDTLVSEKELTQAFNKLALVLEKDLANENPIFVCCMNGGLFATSEIVKRISAPLQLDYVHATRYVNNNGRGKELKWVKHNNIDFKDRVVVLVDDILDGGVTLAEIKKFYEKNGAKKVLTVVMLNKLTNRDPGGLYKADYVGLDVSDRYLYGFGLDYHGFLRNIPSIHAVHEKHMI